MDWHERRESRSFEASAVHALWHLDFHQGSRKVVDTRGVWSTPHLMAVLDDRSRVCCHAQWYLAETAENLVHSLVQAFCKRGLPRAQMHDNGAAMMATETQNGLRDLGVSAAPTVPYSPEQNAKAEVFWAQVESRLMKLIEKVEPLTLEFLNQATAAWVEGDYNHGLHEEIGTTPVKRMIEGPDVSRPAPEIGVLRRRFTAERTPTQRAGDGTVSIKGVRFELPSRLRTLHRPTVRFQSWDLSRAWVIDPRSHEVLAEIRAIDKESNAARGRRTLEPVAGHEPVPAPAEDPIPPLLRKLLGDYAATGLPPAYLPKDELVSSDEVSRD
jgi:transposase InsO family protein